MDEEGLDQYQAYAYRAYAYRAYVLRLWKDGVETPWRASLEVVRSGTRHHFADVEQLIGFLQTATSAPDEEGESNVDARTE